MAQGPDDLFVFWLRKTMFKELILAVGLGPLGIVRAPIVMVRMLSRLKQQALAQGALTLIPSIVRAVVSLPLMLPAFVANEAKKAAGKAADAVAGAAGINSGFGSGPTFNPIQPYPWMGDPWTEPPSDFKNMPWKHWPMWVPAMPSGQPPSTRHRHAAAVVADWMIVFGGYGPNGFLNDVHVLDTKWTTWFRLRVSGTPPAPRAGHSVAAVGKLIFVFGGYGSEGGLFNDVTVLDTGCRITWLGVMRCNRFAPHAKWKSTIVNGPAPMARFGHAMAPVVQGAYLLIAGGYQSGDRQENWRRRPELMGFTNSLAAFSVSKPQMDAVEPRRAPALGAVAVGEEARLWEAIGKLKKPKWRAVTPPPEWKATQEVMELKRRIRALTEKAVTEGASVNRGSLVYPSSDFAPILLTIKGKDMGKCTEHAVVHGVRRCNATCTPATCNEAYWHSNNNAVRVTVADVPCVNVTWFSPDRIQCFLGGGTGVNKTVNVVSNGVESTPNELFDFDPPEILDVSPSFLVDAPSMPRGPVIVYGRNFGARNPPGLEIYVSGEPCLEPRWLSDNALVCPCLGKSSPKELKATQHKAGEVAVKIDNQWGEPWTGFKMVKPPKKVSSSFPESWEPVCPPRSVLKVRLSLSLLAPSPALALTCPFLSPQALSFPTPKERMGIAERKWEVYEAELHALNHLQKETADFDTRMLKNDGKAAKAAQAASEAAAEEAAAKAEEAAAAAEEGEDEGASFLDEGFRAEPEAAPARGPSARRLLAAFRGRGGATLHADEVAMLEQRARRRDEPAADEYARAKYGDARSDMGPARQVPNRKWKGSGRCRVRIGALSCAPLVLPLPLSLTLLCVQPPLRTRRPPTSPLAAAARPSCGWRRPRAPSRCGTCRTSAASTWSGLRWCGRATRSRPRSATRACRQSG